MNGMVFRPDAAVQKHEPMIHFVLCIRKGEDDDLELRKVYAVLPPDSNETGYLRVIDKSGEDYLYSAECFVPLELPQNVEQALLAA